MVIHFDFDETGKLSETHQICKSQGPRDSSNIHTHTYNKNHLVANPKYTEK